MLCNLKNNAYLCSAKTNNKTLAAGVNFFDTQNNRIRLQCHSTSPSRNVWFVLADFENDLQPNFFVLMYKAKTKYKDSANSSSTIFASSGHESTTPRDNKTMSIAEVINTHYPALAKAIKEL